MMNNFKIVSDCKEAIQTPSFNPTYQQELHAIVNYFVAQSGNPKNGKLVPSKQFVVHEKAFLAVYHLAENEPSHLRNSGATTSEGQALFFQLAVLYAIISGDKSKMTESLSYITDYMMPHGPGESKQLPSALLYFSITANHHPVLMHWLIDIAGNHANACGDRVIAEHTLYDIYQPGFLEVMTPSLALDINNLPDFSQRRVSNNANATFSSALDADQWLAEGLAMALHYGVCEETSLLKDIKQSLQWALSNSGTYKNVMQFCYYWGGHTQEKWGFSGTIEHLYSGYQSPDVWVMLSEPEIAKSIVSFLKDAQDAYPNQAGFFMPVYCQGTFGWEGPDTKTHWTGFQFRTFAHLAQYYRLTRDQNAKKVLDKFLNAVIKNGTINDKTVILPLCLEKNSGRVTESAFSPHESGLFAQGLIHLFAGSEHRNYLTLADYVLQSIIKNKNNVGGLTQLSDNKTYGFHNSEIGKAFAYYTLYIKPEDKQRIPAKSDLKQLLSKINQTSWKFW